MLGNPLTYYKNGLTYALSWTNERQLAVVTEDDESFHYSYNYDGIRTSKNVNGVYHEYLLNGSQIIGETWEEAESFQGNLLLYLYDAEGSPIGMRYRCASYAEGVFDTYWFEKNLQGDIVAVYSASGTKLASYVYDAWGNISTAYHNNGSNTAAVYIYLLL